MARVRDIGEYSIILNGADFEKVKEMHRHVGECRESILTDHKLQDVLLNDGYELKDSERPKSLMDIPSPSIPRIKTIAHLSTLNTLINAITLPRVVYVETRPGLWIPGEKQETTVLTSEGFDVKGIDEMSREWFKNPITEVIRKYQEGLKKAFDEYNIQAVLSLLDRCRNPFIDPSYPERNLQEEIKGWFDTKGFGVLDSAYYIMGNRFFSTLAPIYEQLQEDKFGKNFILSAEEEQEFLRQR